MSDHYNNFIGLQYLIFTEFWPITNYDKKRFIYSWGH